MAGPYYSAVTQGGSGIPSERRMTIDLSNDVRQHLTTSIKRFFAENMDEFCLEEIGPSIYNQAVADAQRYVQERVADLGGACYAPPFGYWQD